MQKSHGDIILKATKTKNSGIWMTTIALNGQTSKYYSENDCTYSIVKVPNQSKEINNSN